MTTRALQATAHDACSRKVHCVTKGYLDDPFVQYFARDTTIVNSPLMNRGSWLRTTAIERMVRRFAADLAGGRPFQVLSLGAGVDTLFFRLRREGVLPVARYVEVDLPEMVAEKQRAIASHEQLRDLAAGDVLHLIPGDLRRPAAAVEAIRAAVDPALPTFILAECVFVYIEAAATTALLQELLGPALLNAQASGRTDIMLVAYDAIAPDDRFGRMMVENLRERGIPLVGIHDLPTPDAHVARCHAVGLRSARALTMRALYLTVPREQHAALNKLEMIDDWDEWGIVHEHYVFFVAMTGGDGTAASVPLPFA